MYLWEETAEMPRFPQLEGDAETDVLIIGGGIAGMLCAYFLQQQGVDYLLAEGQRIGSGTTRGTTAALTAQHGAVYTKLVKRFDKEKARLYLDANLDAVKKFETLSEQLDFDFEKKPSYLYSLNDKRTLQVERAVLRELGYPAAFVESPELPLRTAGAVCFPDMAQFHPMKLLAALSEGLRIREHTYVKQLKGNCAYTKTGRITAKKIIVAARYPFHNARGLYPLKLYQKRSFIVALENAPNVQGTYVDPAKRGIYLRNYGDLLLVGGGDCRTGARDDGFAIVREFVQKHFPQAREKYAWAAQDCISLDEVPYIGRYSRTYADCYVLTGFNEWGMSSAMNGASIVTDLILGRENRFADFFAPDRGIFTGQLFANVGETLVNFLRPASRRCSHLGCGLKKNHAEGSWDCPCHGSRFAENGRLQDGPAMRDLH